MVRIHVPLPNTLNKESEQMIISELISKLESMKNTLGDVDVVVEVNDLDFHTSSNLPIKSVINDCGEVLISHLTSND